MIFYHTNMPCEKCKCEYVKSILNEEITRTGKKLNTIFFVCINKICKFRRPKQSTKIYCPEEIIHHVEMDQDKLEAICTPDDTGICTTHTHRDSDS